MRRPTGCAEVRRPWRGSWSGTCACLLLALLLTGCDPGGSGSSIEQAEDQRLADSDELLQAVATGESATRVRAVLALGRIQHPNYTPALVAAAAPAEPDPVRRAALFALGQQGLASGARPSPDALAACSAAAGEPDPEIVALAVEALGKLADPGSVPLLVRALDHSDPRVRAEAAHALFRQRFVPVWRETAETPPVLPDPAVVALIGALSDAAPAVRGAAAHAFSRHAEPRALVMLIGVLNDDDEWVRLFALRALGRIADPAAAPSILRLIADANPRLRTAAVDALAAVGAVGLLPPVALFDEAFQVRAAVARAWGVAEDELTIEFLSRLGQDKSPTVRAAAIEALAARLGDASIAAIDFHLKNPEWTTRAAAARATASLPERGLEFAIKALSDSDIRVRTAGLEALKGRADAVRHILDALSADDLALRGTAVELVAAGDMPDKSAVLIRAYEGATGDAWIEVRQSIVDALAGSDPASPFLVQVQQKDPAAAVRARAWRALLKHGVTLPESTPPQIAASPLLGQHFTEDPLVVLETTHGDIEIRCDAARAPVHVANFVQRARDGFYDGLAWHRVVPNFVVQGGDPRGDGWGSGGAVLRDEINDARFARGTVGMPKSGKDTGGCQLFIALVPTPHLDGNYTVFGHVVGGMEAVDAIEVGDTILRAYVR